MFMEITLFSAHKSYTNTIGARQFPVSAYVYTYRTITYYVELYSEWNVTCSPGQGVVHEVYPRVMDIMR